MITKQSIAMFFGEFLGTFILVFFGTSIVAAAVLFEAAAGLVQVAMVWGIGVTLAIYATRHLSCAHLNPAVSLGMVLTGRMKPRLLLPYWIAQLGGATMAGACVLLIFGSSITAYESAQGSPDPGVYRSYGHGPDCRYRSFYPDRAKSGKGLRTPADRLGSRMGPDCHSRPQRRLFFSLHCRTDGRCGGCRRCFSLGDRPTDGCQADQNSFLRLSA